MGNCGIGDLTPFVPRLALELGTTPGSHWTWVDGSMLSADISGFTALSEKLAGKGKAGAEEITELINTCFTALIDAAYGYGGEIIKFGGDAILVLFRGDQHERRCANAAMAMQIALHSSPAAKRSNLTMTVGASDGPFNVFLAGTTYRDLLIIGPAASKVIHLEGEADKGETLISDALAAHMPAGLTGRRHAGGIALVGAPVDPPSPPQPHAKSAARIEEFIPPQVVEQLAAFSELGGEHRLVSVGFVMVGGIEAAIDELGADGTADALGSLIDGVIAATSPYGVTALHTDIAPDGFKVVLAAGAPINPGDISDAMLQAALAIAEIDSRFTLRIGAQTGRVFAGFLGASYRRTYTLMGDPVNTAARMLGKANDRDIVAVASMVDDTRSVFETDEIEPFFVKGKTEPMVAYHVRGVTDTVRRDGSTTRLVGRAKELDVLSRAIGELGEVVDIVGPAGVGKSRLLDAAWDEAEGFVHQHGACTPYGATSPYSVFRPLLRGAIGIDPKADPVEAGKQLTAFVELRAPDMSPRLPLLAVPFGADVASTPEVDAIDPEFRRASIHEAIVDLYDTTLAGRPVFLVIEDLHWVDDASGELVNHLVRAAATRRWAGVTTRRPEGTWQMETQASHVTTLELEALTDDDIRELAIEASSSPLGDDVLDLIAERSQGNPLFALELTRAVGDGAATELPDSVERVISQRIDSLPPDLRHLVRIASVFGNSFDILDMAPVLERESPGLSIDDPALGDVVERRSGRTWAFRHALYRDAVYEGLPYRRRRELHAQIGRYLQENSPDPVDIAPLLSVHFSQGGVWADAWTYSRIAGEQAAAQYAYTEAAAAFARAMVAAKRVRVGTPAERREVAQQLGDAQLTIGRYDDAFDSYGRARRDADGLDEIDLMRRQGMVRDRQGSLGAAIRWFERCLSKLHSFELDRHARQVRLNVSLAYAAARHRQGKFPECLEWAKAAEADAIRLGDTASQAKALDRLHVAATYLKLPDAERYGPAALELHRELGDHLSQARILDNMGIQAYFADRWHDAVRLYGEAATAGRIAGDVIEANLGRANAAEVYSDRGEFDLARREFTDVLRNWTAAGWSFGAAGTRANLALVEARSGNPDRSASMEVLVDALAEFEQLSAEEFIQETLIRLCEVSIHLDDAATCIAYADRALARVSDPQSTARVHRQLAFVHIEAGRTDEAMRALTESLELAEQSQARYEVGLTSQLLSHVSGGAEHQARATSLLGELGVQVLPAAFQRLGMTRPGVVASGRRMPTTVN